ncbi:MAG: BlaI/MecI/CopY family transcriptional regulator [Candidatus Bathyarchaeia archaeon]
MVEGGKFGKEYVEKEFWEIGLALKIKIRVFLIGGCAMVFRGLKPATKDVDIVFTSLGELKEFVSTLKSLNYYEVVELPRVYEKMGVSAVLRNMDGFQCDLFYKQVCSGLEISGGMIRRAGHLKTFGNLDVYMMSPEDVFLFKGMTERNADLDDMRVLAGMGLNWNVIREECLSQEKRKIWEAFLAARLSELKAMFDIEVPILKEFWKRAGDELVSKVFQEIVKAGKHTFEEIHEVIKNKYKYSESWTRRELKKLVEKGILKARKEKRRLKYFLSSESYEGG